LYSHEEEGDTISTNYRSAWIKVRSTGERREVGARLRIDGGSTYEVRELIERVFYLSGRRKAERKTTFETWYLSVIVRGCRKGASDLGVLPFGWLAAKKSQK